jgi:ribonucleoside-triphosphate reductase
MLSEAARVVVQTNQEWAVKLGIEPAARTTTTKPSGNSSAWLGVTSGIHSAHSPYYLRRVRVDRKSDFGKYLLSFNEESEPNSGGFIETDKFSPENIVITVPVAMEGSVYREDERAIDLMERAKHVYENWISPGHVSGPNTHNVSLTVSYANEEWDGIVDWMVANVDSWSGISLLPYDGGNYEQAPFEEIDRIEYLAWLEKIPHVDFSLVSYEDDELARLGELACSGGQCEIQ